MHIAYIIDGPSSGTGLHAANEEDRQLLQFLRQQGLQVDAHFWRDPSVDWPAYDWAIIKSPWDYHEDIGAFHDWLGRVESANVRLLNPAPMIRWNSDKRYLDAIARAGLPVIPSLYLPRGAQVPTGDTLFAQWNLERIVLKPSISAGAKNTFVLSRDNIASLAPRLQTLLQEQPFLAQPFVEEVEQGEWSFLFFRGQYSHCVLKVPKTGDFRVQHQHGGRIIYPPTDALLVAEAQRYVDRFAKGSLYARVDGIVRHGNLELMELELIEPYLFLDGQVQRMANYYHALEAFIGKG